MGNNPIVNTDPLGDDFGLSVLIGATLGGIIGGGQNGLDGFWKGALTGAIGGAIPNIGFVSNLGNIGSGAITGAVTGGLNSGLNGQNVFKGATIGAAIGGGVGLLQDGLQHMKEVKAAREDLFASGRDPNSAVTMTNAELEKFVNSSKDLSKMYHAAGDPDLYAGTVPPFRGYTMGSDGLFRNPVNAPTAGVTAQSGGNISIHIAPARFSKALKLYTTLGHELNHAVDFYSGAFASWTTQGGRNFARNVSELKAHTWSANVGKRVSFEVARHHQAIKLYGQSMTPADWGTFFSNFRL